MTIEEIKKHLEMHPLFVVERSTSRRGIPSIVSFFVVSKEGSWGYDAPSSFSIINIDEQLVTLIGEGAKLIKVGRVMAASIHDPYLLTLEAHMEDLSIVLFGDPKKLVWRVI